MRDFDLDRVDIADDDRQREIFCVFVSGLLEARVTLLEWYFPILVCAPSAGHVTIRVSIRNSDKDTHLLGELNDPGSVRC